MDHERTLRITFLCAVNTARKPVIFRHVYKKVNIHEEFSSLGKTILPKLFLYQKMGMTKRYLACWRVAADNKIA